MAPAITHAPAAHFLQGCASRKPRVPRSEEHTSELQSQSNLVCRLLLEKKKNVHLAAIRSVGGEREWASSRHDNLQPWGRCRPSWSNLLPRLYTSKGSRLCAAACIGLRS